VRRRAPLVALSAALLVSCARSAEETRFLNFDAETTAGVLGSGWSGWEKTPEGDTFVWAQARTATVRVSSRGDGDRLVRFRAWPYRYPGAPPQNVTLFVNDAKIETATLGDGPRVYAFVAPKAAFRAGANELRLEFTYAEAPKDREPGGADARTLAAAVDGIEIVPPRPPAGAETKR
jgi:hypothetical protein